MMLSRTEEDWSITAEVFRAARSRQGRPAPDDREFLEAAHYFTMHDLT